MKSRVGSGYLFDLENLARLRRAVFNDGRINTRDYAKITDSTFIIENILRKFAKGSKRSKTRK